MGASPAFLGGLQNANPYLRVSTGYMLGGWFRSHLTVSGLRSNFHVSRGNESSYSPVIVAQRFINVHCRLSELSSQEVSPAFR